MVFCGEGPGSAQPCHSSSLPPRALNLARSGSVDSMKLAFFSASARSVSKSKDITSQLALRCPTYRGMSPQSGFIGAPAVGIRAAQPASTPGMRPGYTISPFLLFTGEYSCRADATCGAVRQSAASPALHISVPGSNLHACGSLMMLSLTPSFASHAAITALANSVTLFGGTMRDGSLNISTCRAVWDTFRRT